MTHEVSPLPPLGSALSRRSALKLLAANIALITAGCGKPREEILPYVKMPERLMPGIPLQFASTLPLGGYGRGVVCTSVEGRPIKVSGNPLHPASLGATDLFAEAHVLSLYDPDRSTTCRRDGQIAAYVDLETELAARLDKIKAKNGEGLRLLTGPISSPTIFRQIAALKEKYPGFAWHRHDPLEDGSARRGATLAFGQELKILPRLADADVIVTFDSDPLGSGPWQIVNAEGFARRRRVRSGSKAMSRLYAFESVPTVTGAKADHRFTLAPDQIGAAAVALAQGLGANLSGRELPVELQSVVTAVVKDCSDNKGHALVLAGPSQAPEVHALAHWINQHLAAPITHQAASNTAEPLHKLLAELDAGEVSALLISGTNPAYDTPALRIADRLRRCPFTLHHGLYRDETAALCRWHVPEPHPLESWGDLRALDGTPSLVQPLIEPLYDTRSLAQLLAFFAGATDMKDYDLVRTTWAAQGGTGFETWWRKALEDGVIVGKTPASIQPGEARLPTLVPGSKATSPTLILRPDPTLYDGSFANNAWLQECPKPLTKGVWGNTLGISPDDAAKLEIEDGDTISISVEGREILAPVRVQEGHAPSVMSLALGNGRVAAGEIGNGVGANAFALRSAGEWRLDNVAIRKASGRTAYSTQKLFVIDGDREEIFPVYALAHLPAAKSELPKPSLLPVHDYSQADARWAMVVDNTSCIGCNACVLACQVENNVPVIGPEEIARNRDMHWLRIDAYALDSDDGRFGFEPVPCMQCETAPCEPVCPVEASVHDSEGLNVQVYNRCIGTRFCEANCPYKVRRFNFFGYADGQEYANLAAEVMHLHNNPDVTVRARGVMEKCTYCVQRISAARRGAEKEMRPIRDGEVRTACQSACPTQAIAFGNLNRQDSAVVRLREEQQHFSLLESLNTKPRTTYLADIRNPNPALPESRG
jgi:Fe-S-cluster-containing dehydrogenase component